MASRAARRVFAKMNCKLLACDVEADHLQLLVEYPPKLLVSVLVNAFKGTSSRLLRQERPSIAARYRKGVRWSRSFAASTGGATLETERNTLSNKELSKSALEPQLAAFDSCPLLELALPLNCSPVQLRLARVHR
jgi:putative transposase